MYQGYSGRFRATEGLGFSQDEVGEGGHNREGRGEGRVGRRGWGLQV